MEAPKLFENLITIDEFILLLKNQYKKRTVYSWISKGLPHKKLRGGKVWIVKDEAICWLQRK